MLKLDNTKKLYPLWTSLIGVVVFLLSTILVNLIIVNDLVTVFIPAIAALIFGIIMRLDFKKLIGLVLVFLVAYPLLFALMFIAGYGPGIVAIIVSVLAHVILGLILALMLEGKSKKAILTYIAAFGTLALLVIAFSYIEPINKLLYDVVGIFGRTDGINRVNEAVMPEYKSIGLALGLSFGIARMVKTTENK